MPYCEAAKWGRDTPAWPQAHIVRPEQSNACRGGGGAKRSGTPSWLRAARTAVAAPGDVAGMSIWGCDIELGPSLPPVSPWSPPSLAVAVRVTAPAGGGRREG